MKAPTLDPAVPFGDRVLLMLLYHLHLHAIDDGDLPGQIRTRKAVKSAQSVQEMGR